MGRRGGVLLRDQGFELRLRSLRSRVAVALWKGAQGGSWGLERGLRCSRGGPSFCCSSGDQEISVFIT